MRACWSEDKDSRPTFQELKEEFDGLILNDQQYNYLPLDIDTAEAGIISTKAGVTSTEAGLLLTEEILETPVAACDQPATCSDN